MRQRTLQVRFTGTKDGGLTLDLAGALKKGAYRQRLSFKGIGVKPGEPLARLEPAEAKDFLKDVSLDEAGRQALSLGGSIVRAMRVQDFDAIVLG